jgi:hypothetical protein
MKSLFLLLPLLVLNTPALADKDEKVETKKIEVTKESPHKNLHLYFLDRRPYTAPKNDNINKTSSKQS